MYQLEVDEDRSGITILVVEDNPDLNRLFTMFLERQGFLVISATSFEQAISILQSDVSIDVALLDYELGDARGTDLLSYFPKSDLTQQVPVIVISASEDRRLLARCFELGVDDYIVKPVNPLLLCLKVDSLVYKVRLTKIIATQNDKLSSLINAARLEEQMASYIFYNHLLSDETPAPDGISHYLKSTVDFSGDIILSRMSPSGCVYIFHADATGHGLSSTITLMPVVSIFKAMVQKGYRLEQIVREMNTQLMRQLPPDRFVAASLIEIDTLHNDLCVWNGGMPDLILLNRNHEQVHRFRSQHMALGILDKERFDSRSEHLPIPQGGVLFACSDGLLEQPGQKGNVFTTNKLLDILHQTEARLLDSVVMALKLHAGRDEFEDDVSMFEVDFDVLVDYCERVVHCGGGLANLDHIAPFTWALTLTGSQIANQELPAMCNELLKTMGFPQQVCQRVFTVVSELANNAIDHGVLRLSSSLKESVSGFFDFYAKRDERLQKLTPVDEVSLRLKWSLDEQGSFLQIDVRDTGEGYDFSETFRDNHYIGSGRGLALVQRLSSELLIADHGRHVQVRLR